jgi:hypothetical protein
LLVNESGEYLEPEEEDETSHEALLHTPASLKITLPCALPPHLAVLFCLLRGTVRDLKCWLNKCFAVNLDIFYMFAEMSNNENTEMQLKFQGSRNSSVFVTTLKVGGTGPNLTVANHAVITPKF